MQRRGEVELPGKFEGSGELDVEVRNREHAASLLSRIPVRTRTIQVHHLAMLRLSPRRTISRHPHPPQ